MDLEQDVANFLLLRGDHAYLAAGWGGFPDKIGWSEELFDADYGVPVDEICTAMVGVAAARIRKAFPIVRQDEPALRTRLCCRFWEPATMDLSRRPRCTQASARHKPRATRTARMSHVSSRTCDAGIEGDRGEPVEWARRDARWLTSVRQASA